MALSVAQGFDEFLKRLTPLESQRVAAAKHRSSVESSLRNALDVSLFRETGSFNHGTGIRGHCDVDVVASLKPKPTSSDTALKWVKDALAASFPNTTVRVSRPAVVVEFAKGAETWEVIPGFLTARGGDGVFVYDIPGASGGWMDSAPLEHLFYVNEVNNAPKVKGGVKKLARLMKAWKYYNSVPISSFYLEMRAAKYLASEDSFIPVWDVCRLLEDLESINLGSMNDPRGASGRFEAYSSPAKGVDALSKLGTAATRARKALNESKNGNDAMAFHYLDLLFDGRFPAR
jgi:hypothetical protein